MRNDRNAASKAIGAAKQRGEDAAAEMTRVRELGDNMTALEAELAEMTSRLDIGMLTVPNIVQSDVPTGGEDEGTSGSRFAYLLGDAVRVAISSAQL